ncbi:MAG: histidinol dehydrogenase [Nitrospirae bacterium]|nr:histidinol dehydrogenase [Nitrospirota bacterium]
MKRIQTKDLRFRGIFSAFLRRREVLESGVETAVRKILEDVRREGDQALVRYTRKFDGVTLRPSAFRVGRQTLARAYRLLSREDIRAMKTAAENIRVFHRRQKVDSWAFRKKGAFLGQRVSPLSRVGIYVPGGKAVYPSSVLMNAIPAKVAGVSQVVMCTPIPGGVLNPYLMVAADLAGIDEIYTVGGAQAIGALAFGTKTIPRVDKIVGPGNIYVSTAKKLVFGHVGIDLFAGPSEIAIIADGKADPAFIAADLLSQAEHDEMAVAVLLTPSRTLSERVVSEIGRQQKLLPEGRNGVIRKSLGTHGMIIVTKNLAEAVHLVNEMAPEHLSLQVRNPDRVLEKITHAGAVFLGSMTPQTLGDYVAGPSHVLPTGGTARFSSPLSVEDFVKRSSVISYSGQGLKKEGAVAVRLARAEGLWAHARAVDIRLERSV